MKFKIGITDYITQPYDVEQKAFPNAEFIFLNTEKECNFDPKILSTLDGLIVWHANIGGHTASKFSKGKIIVRYGVGFDNIDIAELTKKGIHFCNTPDYGTEEVADTACGMILNIQRKINSYDLACRNYQSGWQEHVQPPLKRTNKQILGVVGVGRIGTAVINRMKTFGYHILGYDPYQPSGHEKAIGYERKSNLSDLLNECDIISIHCPLNAETRAMVNDDFIQSMKFGAALINTGRGPVISDFNCLERHLRSGHLRAVALDVLPEEPPPKDHELIKAWRINEKWIAGRLIINPHTSYFSEEALYEMRYKAAETIRMFLEVGELRNEILS